MGLLDDAIREHLDLKRRRGADPAEIERLEREALGPVRRDPIGEGASEPGPIALAPDDDLHEEVEDFEHTRADLDLDLLEHYEPAAAGPTGEPAVGHEAGPTPPRRSRLGFLRRGRRDHPEGVRGEDDPADHHADTAPEPPEPATPSPAPAPSASRPEPVSDLPPAPADLELHEEPAVDDVPAHELPERPRRLGAGEAQETVEYDVESGFGEDVLEETPDFLHDTPDHDRLWFEQKPPRDFDL
jgi:hypothetical protein